MRNKATKVIASGYMIRKFAWAFTGSVFPLEGIILFIGGRMHA
jgi:hypothetical protein